MALQRGARVARALFEIALRNGWPTLAERMLALTKAIDNRVWWFQTPLRQLDMRPPLPPDALRNLEEKKSTIEQILDMGAPRERAEAHTPALSPRGFGSVMCASSGPPPAGLKSRNCL